MYQLDDQTLDNILQSLFHEAATNGEVVGLREVGRHLAGISAASRNHRKVDLTQSPYAEEIVEHGQKIAHGIREHLRNQISAYVEFGFAPGLKMQIATTVGFHINSTPELDITPHQVYDTLEAHLG